jgi:hypothetical protein
MSRTEGNNLFASLAICMMPITHSISQTNVISKNKQPEEMWGYGRSIFICSIYLPYKIWSIMSPLTLAIYPKSGYCFTSVIL